MIIEIVIRGQVPDDAILDPSDYQVDVDSLTDSYFDVHVKKIISMQKISG